MLCESADLPGQNGALGGWCIAKSPNDLGFRKRVHGATISQGYILLVEECETKEGPWSSDPGDGEARGLGT